MQKQVSEKDSPKQSYNMQFLQELNVVNLLSQKVYSNATKDSGFSKARA